MKLLVVGAGAIGGYFGGRLAENGKDITFLVRDKRKKQLEKTGLVIQSINGDSKVIPRLITTKNTGEKFDFILISTKSYHLAQAIEDIRPFMKESTIILPLLNGVAHLDQLVEAFGENAVIGGLCYIETTLDEHGTILQKSPAHQIIYGERSGEITPRMKEIEKIFAGTNARFTLSDQINEDIWSKYLFITVFSGITSLMESPIGPILKLETGQNTVAALFAELEAIMRKIEIPVHKTMIKDLITKMNKMPYEMKSSMQRDIEKSYPLEADHLQGFLLAFAHEHKVEVPILETIYTKLKLYEMT